MRHERAQLRVDAPDLRRDDEAASVDQARRAAQGDRERNGRNRAGPARRAGRAHRPVARALGYLGHRGCDQMTWSAAPIDLGDDYNVNLRLTMLNFWVGRRAGFRDRRAGAEVDVADTH